MTAGNHLDYATAVRAAPPRALRILVLTGGHRVDLVALLDMVADVSTERGWVWAHAIQPGAQDWLRPEFAGSWDVILCHDIPGLQLQRGREPRPVGPSPDVAWALAGLLERGKGLVVTHHALAGWPGWPGWGEAIGGRYLYAPGTVRGQPWPSSGYRHDSYRVEPVTTEHPVCAGVEAFDVVDELYSCPVFTDDVVPLLRTDADLDGSRFTSTYEQVVSGESLPLDPQHPPASDLLGWATVAGRSPVVYLLPGDSAATFGLPPYRRLIGNALAWVASSDAHEWARMRPAPVDLSLPESVSESVPDPAPDSAPPAGSAPPSRSAPVAERVELSEST